MNCRPENFIKLSATEHDLFAVHPMPRQMMDAKSIQAIPEAREVSAAAAASVAEKIKIETNAEGPSADGEGRLVVTVQGDGGGGGGSSETAAEPDFMEVPGAVTNGLPETIKEEDEEDVSEHR